MATRKKAAPKQVLGRFLSLLSECGFDVEGTVEAAKQFAGTTSFHENATLLTAARINGEVIRTLSAKATAELEKLAGHVEPKRFTKVDQKPSAPKELVPA